MLNFQNLQQFWIFVKNPSTYLALKLQNLAILHFFSTFPLHFPLHLLRKSGGFPNFLTSRQDNSADFLRNSKIVEESENSSKSVSIKPGRALTALRGLDQTIFWKLM